MKPIVLASESVTRKKLLEQIGIKFTVDASKYKEIMDLNLEPHALAESLKKIWNPNFIILLSFITYTLDYACQYQQSKQYYRV